MTAAMLLFILLSLGSCLSLSILFLVWKCAKQLRSEREHLSPVRVAFFHPYCNAAGGGERVLWLAVQGLLRKYENIEIHIYSVEEASTSEVCAHAQKIFNVDIAATKINLVPIKFGPLLHPDTYPVATLLGQGLGSMFVALHALRQLNPHIYIDTTGFAFTYPVFRWLAGCKVVTYTHYPVITRAMAQRVRSRRPAHNHRALIANNPLLTEAKLLYYKFMAYLYGICGRRAHVVMVNSSWTGGHITHLWTPTECPIEIVYPPCDVTSLKKLKHVKPPNDEIRILAVGQFRPEKGHVLLLHALYELRELLTSKKEEDLWQRIRFEVVGGCRDVGDEERAQGLKDLAKHLSLEDHVRFHLNAPYNQLVDLYCKSRIGVHGMWNEHFGICVVEMMAAGLVTVAHASGGPKLDIISEGVTGFLASEPREYAEALRVALHLSVEERDILVARARSSTERFSTEQFERAFLTALEPLMKTFAPEKVTAK